MTKNIRIENADTGCAIVAVDIVDDTPDGKVVSSTQYLPFPTAMTQVALTSTRSLVIREASVEEYSDVG